MSCVGFGSAVFCLVMAAKLRYVQSNWVKSSYVKLCFVVAGIIN